MLTAIKNKAELLLTYFPVFDRITKTRDYKRQFKTELDLIKGVHRNISKHPSIIHFSINKAATQYTKSILSRCAINNGLVPVRIHEYAFDTDFPYLDSLTASEMKRYRHIFKERGYLYTVFGSMVEGIHLEQYKVVLMVRDPRDILVSDYFSAAYSHLVPAKSGNKHKLFMQKRKKARATNIDEYAISESCALHNIFLRYKILLLDRYPHAYVTTYEHMVADFEGWLNGLTGYCELDVSNSLFNSLIDENGRMRPKRENIQQHLRKGLPGDHKEKLNTKTIDYLNAKFDTIFATFGYDGSPTLPVGIN